jgi:tyrosine-protein kinase Etk/Wzc
MKEISPKEEMSIDIFFLLSILFKYKWFVIIATGLVAVAVFLFTLITAVLPPEINPLPDTYRATTLLLIDEKMSRDIWAPFSWWEKSVMAGEFPSNFSHGELAIKLLKSNTVIDAIAEEYSLGTYYRLGVEKGEKVRQQIIKRLILTYDENTMTLNIAYEDHNPEMAFKIANRLVQLLKEMFFSINNKRTITKKELLEQKLTEVSSAITEMETKVEEFQSKYGVLDIESITQEKSTIMANLRSQLFLKEMELKTYSQFSTIEDPVYMRLKAERNNLLRLIREMESGYSSYQNLLPTQKDLPAIATEYSHLKRDLMVQEKIYEALIQQYALIKLSLEGEETLFQVIEYAEVPKVKVGPARMLICMMTTFIGFVINMLLVFIFYWVSKNKDKFLFIIRYGSNDNRKKKIRA